MTTDTRAKAASRRITIGTQQITLTGISKGAGMIRPNMATMLSFIATDAGLSQPVLDALTKHAADRSFNCITVDGDTSTNDSFVIIATGQADLPLVTSIEDPIYAVLRDAITELAQTLAQLIVRDAEGATKFITIQVEGVQLLLNAARLPMRLVIRHWLKRLFLPLIQTLAASYARLATLALRTLRSTKLICISMMYGS